MFRNIFIVALGVLWSLACHAGPYSPAAGEPNSTAIPAEGSKIVAWATGAFIERGFVKIDDPSQGYASHGTPSDALGLAQGGSVDGVVSLGDGGYAVLTFEKPIADGPGYDFAVFENSFGSGESYFCELAFVEVSSDGIHFQRFPAVSLTPILSQIQPFGYFAYVDPTDINNLAGKYRAGYGVPFDLAEIKNMNPLVDTGKITHIRIVDVIGCINPSWASYDSLGNIINDPWPTNFSTGGFDLDGVGVIHQKTLNADLYADGIVNLLDFELFAEGQSDSVGLSEIVDSWLQIEPWFEQSQE